MKVFSKIVAVLLGLLALCFIGIFMYLNVIPLKYFLLLLLGILVLSFLVCFYLFRKKTHTGTRLFYLFLSLLVGFCFVIGIRYAYATLHFMEKAGAIEEESEKYYVMVRKDSSYDSLEKVKGKKISMFKENDASFDKALQLLEEKISFTKNKYTDLRMMGTDLLKGKIEVIFVKEAHKELFDEEIDTFAEKTRVLETITVQTKVESISKDVDSRSVPFSVFVSGIDTYGSISTRSRSDVNMVVTVNPNTYEILLTAIPRDYYVQLHGTTGSKDKLTHAGIYGINMSVQTIEDLLQTSMNYYIRVNFDTLVKVVDVIGGIDVYSDRTIRPWADLTMTIPKGMNHMDGKTALAYARERHAYEEGDRHRGQNQQDVIASIIKKVTSSKTLLTKYTDILKSLEGSFQTNFPMNDMTNLVKKQIDQMPSWKIQSYNLNGYDASNVTYSMGNMRLYVMEPDWNTVGLAQGYIKGMKEGKTLQELGLS